MSIIDDRNFSKKVQFLVENIKSSDILYTGLFSPQVIFTLLHFQFRPILNSPRHVCVYYFIWDIGIRQVSNLPADNEGEGVKIKRGEYFPVYSNIDIPYHSCVDSLCPFLMTAREKEYRTQDCYQTKSVGGLFFLII